MTWNIRGEKNQQELSSLFKKASPFLGPLSNHHEPHTMKQIKFALSEICWEKMNKTCVLCLKRQTLWIYGFETVQLNKTWKFKEVPLFRNIKFAQKDYQCKKRYNIGRILNHLLNLFIKGVAKWRWYVFSLVIFHYHPIFNY